MSRVAAIILNRNLPEPTDQIVEKLKAHDAGNLDVYVVESGSDRQLLSKHCTWWADWPEVMRDGLRYPRGFNFGLSQLYRAGKFADYDYYLLICNDVDFEEPLAPILVGEMEQHPRVGIMSPCSVQWVERELIGENETRYVSHGNHLAWMLRRSFIEAIMERHKPDFMNFLYDGTNFRGYFADQELIIKGYINEYATAITTKVLINEQADWLKTRHDLIRTDHYDVNLRRLLEEGQEWMRRKYGFNDRHQMSITAKLYYDRFFSLHPYLTKFRL